MAARSVPPVIQDVMRARRGCQQNISFDFTHSVRGISEFILNFPHAGAFPRSFRLQGGMQMLLKGLVAATILAGLSSLPAAAAPLAPQPPMLETSPAALPD